MIIFNVKNVGEGVFLFILMKDSYVVDRIKYYKKNHRVFGMI